MAAALAAAANIASGGDEAPPLPANSGDDRLLTESDEHHHHNNNNNHQQLPNPYIFDERVGRIPIGAPTTALASYLPGGTGGGGGGACDLDTLARWVPDSHYRRLMEMNSIPRDPAEWNSTQVCDSPSSAPPTFVS